MREYLPGDYFEYPLFKDRPELDVRCLVVHTEDGRPVKIKSLENLPMLLKHGWFEEDGEIVLYEHHFFLS